MDDSHEFSDSEISPPEVPYTPEEAGRIFERERTLLTKIRGGLHIVELPNGELRSRNFQEGPEVTFYPKHFDGLGHGQIILRRDPIYRGSGVGPFFECLEQTGGVNLIYGALTETEVFPLVESYTKEHKLQYPWKMYFEAAFATIYIAGGRQIRKFCRFPLDLPLPEGYESVWYRKPGVGIPGGSYVERPFRRIDLERVNTSLDLLEKIKQST